MAISRSRFLGIIAHWVHFHNKRFDGKDEQDEQNKKQLFANEYYDSLKQWPEDDIIAAFKGCRDKYDYFPRISQLHKERPRTVEDTSRNLPDKIPIPPHVRSALEKGFYGRRLGEKELKEMEIMLRRHPTLGDPHQVENTMKRWRAENESRPAR